MLYNPLRFFIALGTAPFVLGMLLSLYWLYLFFGSYDKPRIPTLILAAIMILIGVQLWIFGLVADLMAANRQLLEDIQLRLRRSELDKQNK